jgi:biotin carboxylase
MIRVINIRTQKTYKRLESGMSFNSFLIIGFTGVLEHIQYALDTGITLHLLIEESRYKPEYDHYFSSVTRVKNIFDIDEIEDKLATKNITHVLTRFEDYIGVSGAINDLLGLDGFTYRTARNFSNKYTMKKRWIMNSVPCADGICVDDISAIDPFLATHSFPLILKKTSGTHSNFVFKVASKEDLLAKISTCKSSGYSVAKPMVHDKVECDLLLETLLAGDEITVDTFVSGERFTHTPICQYILPEEVECNDSYLPVRYAPVKLNKSLENKIFATVEAALRALGAKNCVCHTELFISKKTDEVWLIESAVRSGGHRSKIINTITSSDYNKAIFLAKMGMEIPSFEQNGLACSVIEYFADKEGNISRLNLDFLNNFKEQIDVDKVRYTLGDRVKRAQDGGKSIVELAITSKESNRIREISKQIFLLLQQNIVIS